jgi:hypothetical protein
MSKGCDEHRRTVGHTEEEFRRAKEQILRRVPLHHGAGEP